MAQSVGVAALVEARKHVGYKETPAKSNRTMFGKWFGVDGVPWCNIFTSYCFSVGAGVTLCKGFNAPGVYAKGCTYVPSTMAWLKQSGQWRGYQTPAPGDIAIYNWDGGPPDHIGIVEEWLGNGTFTAIEGNTAYGNDSNGGEVMRRTRSVKNVDGFGRLHGTVGPPEPAKVTVLKGGRIWLKAQKVTNSAMWKRVMGAAGKATLTIRKAK